MEDQDRLFHEDVAKVQRIPIVQQLLDVVCRTTGMGFAAIARVTENRWITCSVRDNINFGLNPGDELNVETTICHEIRQSGQLVVFDDADQDPIYSSHHTPKFYGLKSYISVPIIEKNGNFFGTLCAIDSKPHKVNTEETLGMFTLFAELISFHMQALDEMKRTTVNLAGERTISNRLKEKLSAQDAEILRKDALLLRNDEQLKINAESNRDKDLSIDTLHEEISALAYISSHDLQEPLRKIQMFSNVIWEQERESLNAKSLEYLTKIRNAAERLQSLITDLLTYSTNSSNKNRFVSVNLEDIIYDALNDLKEELLSSNAQVDVSCKTQIGVIPNQIRQLIFNLLSNSIKFRKKVQQLKIKISCTIKPGNFFNIPALNSDIDYCVITYTDNGIGFDPQFSQKIFQLFKRLDDDRQIEGTGIGLAIAKKVINNHNGYISATGEEGKGATFTIYLPQKL